MRGLPVSRAAARGARTVPTAMLCAASSIHHSPLSHSDAGGTLSPAAASAEAAAAAGSAAGAPRSSHPGDARSIRPRMAGWGPPH